MTDEKKIIKEAIDDIKPDVYMKTRLQAKIEEPKRKSAKSFLKPALSCTLALAVLAGVGTYGMTRDILPSPLKRQMQSFQAIASISLLMRRTKTATNAKISLSAKMTLQLLKIIELRHIRIPTAIRLLKAAVNQALQ